VFKMVPLSRWITPSLARSPKRSAVTEA